MRSPKWLAGVSVLGVLATGCSSSQEVELLGDSVHILVIPEPTDGNNDMLTVATLGLDERTGCVVDEATGRPVAFPEDTSIEGDQESWKVVSPSGQEFTDGDVVQGNSDDRSEVRGHGELPTACGPPPWNVIRLELGPGNP